MARSLQVSAARAVFCKKQVQAALASVHEQVTQPGCHKRVSLSALQAFVNRALLPQTMISILLPCA